MGTTTNFAWPVPELTDPPDGPAQFKALGNAIDATVKTVKTTADAAKAATDVPQVARARWVGTGAIPAGGGGPGYTAPLSAQYDTSALTSTAGAVTVNKSGYYEVSGVGTSTGAPSANVLTVYVYRNSVAIATCSALGLGAGVLVSPLHVAGINLTVGDRLEVTFKCAVAATASGATLHLHRIGDKVTGADGPFPLINVLPAEGDGSDPPM